MLNQPYRTFRFEKAAVLQRLKENKENHRAKVEKVWERYQEKVTQELEKQLERAKKGKKVNHNFLLHYPVPKDFTKEYEQIIDMIESTTDSSVELTQQEFNCYMRDEWNWTQEFVTTSTSYNIS